MENKDLNERAEKASLEIKEILDRHHLMIGTTAFITKEGTISSRAHLVEAPEAPKVEEGEVVDATPEN